MDVKSEKFHDWNGNETPNDSSEISTPLEEPVKTEMDSVNESTDNTETVPAPQEANKSQVAKPKSKQKYYYGPIPGIPVGTCWEKRMQVARAKVHPPPMAGIYGNEAEGACSIVFSGTYADDKDMGDEIIYSGMGGQMHNQTLTGANKALAISCNADFNDQDGAEAQDWKAGKPIRVIRTYKLKKCSEYAPSEGNRYDGIYKVVKYTPVRGKGGLIVWSYLLRRDDPEPAPWTKEGQRIIEEQNLQMIREETPPVKQSPKKKVVKRSSGNSTWKNDVYPYPYPDEETFRIVIEKSLSICDGPKSPRKKTKTKWRKPWAENDAKNQNYETQYESSSYTSFQSPTGDIDVNSLWSPLVTSESPESPRKRSRKQKLNEFSSTEPCEYAYYPIYAMHNNQEFANAQPNYLVSPTSGMKETDENDQSAVESMEIMPDITYFQGNTSPGLPKKRKKGLGFSRSEATCDQPTESTSNLSTEFTSVKSLKRKNVAANRIPANKIRNTAKNRMADVVEPLKPQNQIDLTVEDDKAYVLPEQIEKSIECDTLNQIIWEYCKKKLLISKAKFLDEVKLMFTCRYCYQLASNPVTTPCNHNICLECISNRFSKQTYSCPDCRNNLTSSFKIKENRNLAHALEQLFPNYNMRY